MSFNVADPPLRALPQKLRTIELRPPPWWSWAGLALLLVAGVLVVAVETRGTTFWADEWQWILNRRGGGIGSLLEPHNSHLSLVPIAIYKLLFATAGLRHYWPYRAVMIVGHLTCATLVFAYVRTRTGGFVALLAATLIVFFGPGWQEFLWPFQIAWLIAIGAGVGALMCLDRGTRVGDAAACLLVGVALASAGPGLAVAVGVLVDVILRRRPRDLWIALVPIGLYVIWALGYQHTLLNRHALLVLPRFMWDAAAGVLSSLTGLADVDVLHDSGTFVPWGAPLVVLSILVLAVILRRPSPRRPRLVSLLALLLAFWLITGIGRAYVSLGPLVLSATGDESRYLYVGAVFTVLLAAELLGRRRVSLLAGGISVVFVAAAVISNFGPLRAGVRLLRSQAHATAGELASLEIGRGLVSPAYASNGFIFGILHAGPYFDAERSLGSPLPGPPTVVLAGLPDAAQAAADGQLINIQGPRLLSASGSPARLSHTSPHVDTAAGGGAAMRSSGCVALVPSAVTAPGSAAAIALTVPPTGLELSARGQPLSVSVRRFSQQFQPLGGLSPTGRARLRPRPDAATQPWHVMLSGGAVEACALG